MVVGIISKIKCPKVSIIIVNWNGKEYLGACLTSVLDQTYPNYDVILVDNGSTDDSIEFVSEKYPEVKTIKLDKNHGFAKGNNIGIKEALKDEKNEKYIALLNNDTNVDKNWLSELVKAAETENSKVGIYASKILKMDKLTIDSTGHVFKFGMIVDRGHNKIDREQYDDKLDVIGACAAACLYKREMLGEIGLFDESFFAYFEDADLSWRAYKNRWKARYVPTSVVYHKGGGTSKKSKEFERKMRILIGRNEARIVRRHAIPLQKSLFILRYAIMAIMSWVGMRIGRNFIVASPYIEILKEFFRYRETEQKK